MCSQLSRDLHKTRFLPQMAEIKELSEKERLDRAGRQIVRAVGLDESEVREIVSSPLLYARVRRFIESKSEPLEVAGFWAGLGLASRKAIPAMSLVAAISLGLLLLVNGNGNGNRSASQAFSLDAYLGTSESGIDNVLFAERRPLTTDEVLTTVVSRDEREAAR